MLGILYALLYATSLYTIQHFKFKLAIIIEIIFVLHYIQAQSNLKRPVNIIYVFSYIYKVLVQRAYYVPLTVRFHLVEARWRYAQFSVPSRYHKGNRLLTVYRSVLINRRYYEYRYSYNSIDRSFRQRTAHNLNRLNVYERLHQMYSELFLIFYQWCH
ncbi:unnamed protein product [Chrysodeixis includens]|uniref:Uncharacterized protein n=1 Tax=Chrysodeixis includens TaxID=689277 RepID=A0A9N8L5A0_CHRIL|nr:unnamed protein product [Chrysodeixis includens]